MGAERNRSGIIYLGAFLMLICLASAAALSFTYEATIPRIQAHRAQAERDAMNRVLPGTETFAELGVSAGIRGVRGLYRGLNGATTVGYVVVTEVGGYAGPIVVMVGVGENRIRGVEILQQSETPGLGARIVEAQFLEQFSGVDAHAAPARIPDGGEIDTLAGATISTIAVIEAVDRALEAFVGLGGER